jgi:ribonuclease P protein component
MSTNHNCLVEWNDINKLQPWVNFFALSLNNPTPIIWFARKRNLLDKMSFQQLVHYCKARTLTDNIKIHKPSPSSNSTNYKFGIQVSKGIKNAIHLNRNNSNNLWQEAIKTELKQLKQLTNYHTFIVIDSEEAVPNVYQKIPNHLVFDVKYDLIHTARLVAGANWTEIEKEDIY